MTEMRYLSIANICTYTRMIGLKRFAYVLTGNPVDWLTALQTCLVVHFIQKRSVDSLKFFIYNFRGSFTHNHTVHTHTHTHSGKPLVWLVMMAFLSLNIAGQIRNVHKRAKHPSETTHTHYGTPCRLSIGHRYRIWTTHNSRARTECN